MSDGGRDNRPNAHTRPSNVGGHPGVGPGVHFSPGQMFSFR
jgi:hypothetical protein